MKLLYSIRKMLNLLGQSSNLALIKHASRICKSIFSSYYIHNLHMLYIYIYYLYTSIRQNPPHVVPPLVRSEFQVVAPDPCRWRWPQPWRSKDLPTWLKAASFSATHHCSTAPGVTPRNKTNKNGENVRRRRCIQNHTCISKCWGGG